MGWISGIAAIGGALLNRQGSKSGSKNRQNLTETFQLGSRDVNVLLDQIMAERDPRSVESIQMDSITRAEQDVSGVVDQLFRQHREQNLPQIFSAQTGAGAFGSSGAQTLANDAFARTVGQVSELTLGVANTYASQRLQFQREQEQLLTQLFQLDMTQSGTTTSKGRVAQSGRQGGTLDINAILQGVGAIMGNNSSGDTLTGGMS